MLYNKSLFKEVDEESKGLYLEIIDLSMKLDKLDQDIRNIIPGFECHSLCRAFARLIPELRFVDGFYIGISCENPTDEKPRLKPHFCHHTWLETPKGLIIDPWPVGIISLNALLVVNKGKYSPYGAGHYIEDQNSLKNVITRSVKWRSTRIFNILDQNLLQKPT